MQIYVVRYKEPCCPCESNHTPMWPSKVGGKYANAWGSPMHWHDCPLLFLSHVAQHSRGQVCQCVWLHAAPCIGIRFAPNCVWAMWPRKVGESMLMQWVACTPHALAYFCPYLSGLGGLDQQGAIKPVCGKVLATQLSHTFWATICHPDTWPRKVWTYMHFLCFVFRHSSLGFQVTGFWV